MTILEILDCIRDACNIGNVRITRHAIEMIRKQNDLRIGVDSRTKVSSWHSIISTVAVTWFAYQLRLLFPHPR